MKNKLLLILLTVLSTAGIVYYGGKLLNGSPGKKPDTANAGSPLRIVNHSLRLEQTGDTLTVPFDSLNRIAAGYLSQFDALVSRTELYSAGQLGYARNRDSVLSKLNTEKATITEYLKKTGIDTVDASLQIRQLVFNALMQKVKVAGAAQTVVVNKNKEIALAEESPAALPEENPNRPAIIRLLICAGILALLALAALFMKNNNAMAKQRKKKSETDEEFLKRAVYDLLGRDTAEARYFTEVLSGYKNYNRMSEQLKPEGKPDTGSLINNMKTAGLLTAGESKALFELHALKEKVAKLKLAGTSAVEKQQHLLQLLGSLTADETLKTHFQQQADEGFQWQKLMSLNEAELPAALQHMVRYYDEKYGNGAHKLSPVYAETLRRAQLEIPENFAKEDRFLKALYEQYRNLLDDVYYTWFAQQQSEEKLAEARQTLVNRLAQLAFHAHSFLTAYNKDTAALPPAAVKGNIQLVTEKGTVTQNLPRDAYKTYTRDITKFEREIFMARLLSGIGVNNLDNVLVKDVYFPRESFES